MYAEGVVITTDYGVGPATKTVGIGDPTEAYQPAVASTLPNFDVELFPAKTIEGGTTTTIAAETTFPATQTAGAKCKYVPGPADYLYIIWDVFAWKSDDQGLASLANDFHGRLKARNVPFVPSSGSHTLRDMALHFRSILLNFKIIVLNIPFKTFADRTVPAVALTGLAFIGGQILIV